MKRSNILISLILSALLFFSVCLFCLFLFKPTRLDAIFGQFCSIGLIFVIIMTLIHKNKIRGTDGMILGVIFFVIGLGITNQSQFIIFATIGQWFVLTFGVILWSIIVAMAFILTSLGVPIGLAYLNKKARKKLIYWQKLARE